MSKFEEAGPVYENQEQTGETENPKEVKGKKNYSRRFNTSKPKF